MEPINLNTFAQKIAEKEGGKTNLPISEIMEVLRCARDVCQENPNHHAFFSNYLSGLDAGEHRE